MCVCFCGICKLYNHQRGQLRFHSDNSVKMGVLAVTIALRPLKTQGHILVCAYDSLNMIKTVRLAAIEDTGSGHLQKSSLERVTTLDISPCLK